MKTVYIVLVGLFISFIVHAEDKVRYKHILITNDDGIDDIERLKALANAVKQSADRVSIFVADADKSGTSNHTILGKQQTSLTVKTLSIDSATNIAIYTTPGNPADCVLLSLCGFFGNDRPDLVLSGINRGTNSGPQWFGSGTIGAVRMAGFLQVKAIAFSGCEEKDADFPMLLQWINKLIVSPLVALIDRNAYLTVEFPEYASAIKGVKLSDRRIACEIPENIITRELSNTNAGKAGNITTWKMDFKADPRDLRKVYDDSYVKENFIVITPMSIDENNPTLLKKGKKLKAEIPEFKN